MLSGGVKPLKLDRGILGCTLSLRYHLEKSTITSVSTTNMIISLAKGHGCSSKDDISKDDSTQACSGLIFKGLLLKTLGKIHALQEKDSTLNT